MKTYILDPDKVYPPLKAPRWPVRRRSMVAADPAHDDDDALHDEDFALERKAAVDPLEERVLWESMLQELDFQKNRWFLWDPGLEQWEALSDERVTMILRSYEFTDPEERRRIKRLFRERSRNSTRIDHKKGEGMGYPFDPERVAKWKPPPEQGNLL